MDRAEAQMIADGLVKLSPGAAFDAGLRLLKADYPEMLLPAARRLSERHPNDGKLAQLCGLAARASGESAVALASFKRAARLSPRDPLVAHSLARTSLEAGMPATNLFERAAILCPQDGSVLLGLAAALVAEGRAHDAVAHLERLLARNPLWIDGQRACAHILGQIGDNPVSQISAALTSLPGNAALHGLHVTTLLEARRLPDALAALTFARQECGDVPWLQRMAGHIQSELGDLTAAESSFAAAPSASANDTALEAHHHLRSARPDTVAALLEPKQDEPTPQQFWPYLSLAWRLLGDTRHDWLEGESSLVGVYDLADQVGDLPALADHLRQLHFAVDAPLDQSVRGGTQTDGNLLLRCEKPIADLRKVLTKAVTEHVDRMSAARTGHPTLLARREPRRIAGSWSVRLQSSGFHVDHVHSQGWLSSAFYVALPGSIAPALQPDAEPASSSGFDGWLSLGESRDLVPELQPFKLVEPKPGRLVIFPSTMWHGTRPFSAGERISVAFDIAIPKQY